MKFQSALTYQESDHDANFPTDLKYRPMTIISNLGGRGC